MKKETLENRSSLFWEIPESSIKTVLDNSPEWVISRVFEYGSIADIDQVIALYGTEKVVGILTKTTMRPITRAMAFLFLGIDSDGRYHV